MSLTARGTSRARRSPNPIGSKGPLLDVTATATHENNDIQIVPPRPELLAGVRNEYETDTEVMACNDYLRMGVSRSIAGLARQYKRESNGTGHLSANTLYHASWDYGWANRAAMYDAKIDIEKTKIANEILHSGLADPLARVKNLKRMAELLAEEIARPGRLYLRDIKQVGTGKYAHEVEVIRFNGALVEQYRGLLEDIAKETGGRQKQGSDDDHPISISVSLKPQQLIEPEEEEQEAIMVTKPQGVGSGMIHVNLASLEAPRDA
jgi:hypothetical protein